MLYFPVFRSPEYCTQCTGYPHSYPPLYIVVLCVFTTRYRNTSSSRRFRPLDIVVFAVHYHKISMHNLSTELSTAPPTYPQRRHSSPPASPPIAPSLPLPTPVTNDNEGARRKPRPSTRVDCNTTTKGPRRKPRPLLVSHHADLTLVPPGSWCPRASGRPRGAPGSEGPPTTTPGPPWKQPGRTEPIAPCRGPQGRPTP